MKNKIEVNQLSIWILSVHTLANITNGVQYEKKLYKEKLLTQVIVATVG